MKLLGIDFFDDVVRVNLREVKVSDVSPLAGLTRLDYVDLGHTQVSDLTPLAGLKSLRMLVLREN